MDLTGNMDTTGMENIIKELNTWCMNYRGFVNQIFSSQVTMEEKVTQLFWVVKQVCESQIDVMNNYNELYNYVTNYFKNLDITQEISDKIDEMASSGELANLIDRFMLMGKKVAWFGDSLIWGDKGDSEHTAVEKNIPTLFAEKANCECVSYARKSATLTTYGGGTNNAQSQISQSVLTDCDYAVIEFSANDYSAGAACGTTKSTDRNIFAGALNIAIDEITAKNNDIVIVVLGIFPSNKYFNANYNSWRSCIESYDITLKKVCKYRNVKYISMLECSGINKQNFSQYSSDGTHFNQAGYELLCEGILNNWGGNSWAFEKGNNVLNRNLYPSYDTFGKYQIVANQEPTNYNSYIELNIKPGKYMLSFDYYANYNGSPDTQNGYCGIHFRGLMGDSTKYLVSPIGFEAPYGHLDTVFNVDTEFNGIFIFANSNTTGTETNEVYIFNVDLIPLEGDIVTFNENYQIETNAGVTINVRRTSGGSVETSCSGTLTSALGQYAQLANNSGMNKIINADGIIYFPVFVTKSDSGGQVQVFRGQLNKGQLSINTALSENDVIAFSFSV